MDPDLSFFARYPFMRGASQMVKDGGPSVDELLFDLAYERARTRGAERARSAVVSGDVPGADPATPSEALIEILSYVVARMIVSCTGDKYGARRLALAESKALSARLSKDDASAAKRVADELGIELSGNGDIDVHFTTYVQYASRFKDPTWKLVNQRLSGGFVSIEPEKLARLCEEALRLKIEAELPIEPSDDIVRAFHAPVAELKSVLEGRRLKFEGSGLKRVELSALPPCMKRILAQLQAGENAPHTARFAITSFLHTAGMDSEEIMRLFSTAPDFKEDKTRYQVEHITGKSSGTEYSPPTCATMQTWGICPLEEMDARCNHPTVTSPMGYYRWAARDVTRKQAPVQPEEKAIEATPESSPVTVSKE